MSGVFKTSIKTANFLFRLKGLINVPGMNQPKRNQDKMPRSKRQIHHGLRFNNQYAIMVKILLMLRKCHRKAS